MTLLFVGDVMLGRLVNEVLKKEPSWYPWGDTLPIFQQVDLRICNLECVISDWGTPWSTTPKMFHFRSDGKNVNVLKEAKIDIVSLANNHVLDFEYKALFSMLKTLDQSKIKHAGAGSNFREASASAVTEVDGKRIGLIAFTDNEPEWEATENRPGVFYVPVNLHDERADILFEIIKNIRKTVDLLIVSAHWGPNWGYYPPSEHVVFGKSLIDAGADIVFGHSSHVVRGIETYRERPLLYSAGDFVDDYAVDEIERNDQSFIFVVETDFKKFHHLYLYPIVIRNFQAKFAKGKEKEEMISLMRGLCLDLGTESIWDDKKNRIKIDLRQ